MAVLGCGPLTPPCTRHAARFLYQNRKRADRSTWLGMNVEDMVRQLADEFSVTLAAMGVRVQQMKLVSA